MAKVKRQPPAVPATARGMLVMLDRFLVKGGPEARALWNIMAALRGPDDTTVPDILKDQTTIHIRMKAFPRVVKLYRKLKHRVPAIMFTKSKFDHQYYQGTGSDHFKRHIKSAVNGLKHAKRDVK